MLALEEEKIPYQFLASRGLYSKKIILDLIRFFKLLDNYHESLALNRVLSMPMFGYDIKDLARLNYLAKRKTLSLYEAIGQIPLIEKYSRLAPIKKPSELLIKFLGEDNFVKTLNPEDISYINQFLDRIKKCADITKFGNDNNGRNPENGYFVSDGEWDKFVQTNSN